MGCQSSERRRVAIWGLAGKISTNLKRKPHDKPAAYNRPAKQNGEVESDAADDDNTHASITHTNPSVICTSRGYMQYIDPQKASFNLSSQLRIFRATRIM